MLFNLPLAAMRTPVMLVADVSCPRSSCPLGLPLPLLPRANTPRSGITPLPPLVPTQFTRVMPHLHATANANVLEGLLSYPHLDTLLKPYHTCSSTCLLLRRAHPSWLSLTCHAPFVLPPSPTNTQAHPTHPFPQTHPTPTQKSSSSSSSLKFTLVLFTFINPEVSFRDQGGWLGAQGRVGVEGHHIAPAATPQKPPS